jgi:DNA polymerase elongation subunit (family B)
VLSVKELGLCEDYVYDLETEEGVFQAGIGNMIVHNTDSVFLNIDTTHLDCQENKIAFSMINGVYGSEKITDHLRSFNNFRPEGTKWGELEYEKVYGNLILFTKKRYTGTLFEFNPEKHEYIDKKGIALKRRDYCELVKEIYYDSLQTIFDETKGDPETRKALILKVVRDHVNYLLSNKVKFEKLILSKQLKDAYKIRDQKNTYDKKCKSYKFNTKNIAEGECVFFADSKFEYETTVVKKFERKTSNFFHKQNKSNNYGKDLLVIITQVYDRRENARKKLENPTTNKLARKKIGKRKYLSYADITFKKGFTITLNKIIDPETTDKELEPVTQAHVRLTRKMYFRDAGSAPRSGSRVPFVFIESDNPDVLQHEKAEYPKYAQENGLKPDPLYYLEKQLRKPIGQLISILYNDIVSDNLFDDAVMKYNRKKKNQKSIMDFFGGGGMFKK